MGPIIAVPLLLAALAVWAYLKFRPRHDNPDSVAVFDRLVIGLGAALCVIWFVAVRSHLVSIGLEKYIKLIGLGGGSAFAAVYFSAFLLVRNFYIFRSSRNNFF